MAAAAPIRSRASATSTGAGALREADPVRRRHVEIRAGEIVIVTGPSGSGKTTLLTLIGALRSAQEGSLRVLGQELRGAPARELRSGAPADRLHLPGPQPARRAHRRAERRDGAAASHRGTLARARRAARRARCSTPVGLGERARPPPVRSSRAASASASRSRARSRPQPRIILADEPTASLDKQSGREVVDLMHDLAQRAGRDRAARHARQPHPRRRRPHRPPRGRPALVVHARRSPPTRASMMELLAQSHRKGELPAARGRAAPSTEFARAARGGDAGGRSRFLRRDRARPGRRLPEHARAGARRVHLQLRRAAAGAERASLFLVDARARASSGSRSPRRRADARSTSACRSARGIAGARGARPARALRVDDAYAHPLFNPEVDRQHRLPHAQRPVRARATTAPAACSRWRSS